MDSACAIPDDGECKELDAFTAKLQGITPEQIREYLRTQNAEEKLKKADEILGKIMSAMVASVGFQLSQNELDQFGKMEVTPTTQPHVPVTTLPPVAQPNPEDRQAVARHNRNIRNAIQSATTQEQAMAALASMGSNFSQSLAGSGLLTQEQIRQLSGRFEGSLTYDSGTVVKARMDFNGRLVRQKIEGRSQVQIYDANGKVVSNGQSRGDLTGTFTGDPNSVFIEIGSAYMQLAYFPEMDIWMGNYLKSQKGSLMKQGTVMLQRR